MRMLPPIWFLFAIGAMTALHVFAPAYRWLHFPWTLAGVVLILVGLACTISGATLFVRRKTPLKPFTESTTLVTDGLYRVTRNPMYLGMVIILLGIATLLGTLTPLFVIPVFVVIIQTLFIRKEEQLLTARFGDPYVEYRQRVRRWL